MLFQLTQDFLIRFKLLSALNIKEPVLNYSINHKDGHVQRLFLRNHDDNIVLVSLTLKAIFSIT